MDGQVLTSSINFIISLNVAGETINDLTGIEDFTQLSSFNCINNNLTSLDLSQNSNLSWLSCSGNQLTSLTFGSITQLTYLNFRENNITAIDVSNFVDLEDLYCDSNPLTQLNVMNNINLVTLLCHHDSLSELDVSNSPNLEILQVVNNKLTCLNIRNGNNVNMDNWFLVEGNPDLTCIEVDDVNFANTYLAPMTDPWSSFSENCNNNCTSTVGTNELASGLTIRIYPNPIDNGFSIENNSDDYYSVIITDISGKQMESYQELIGTTKINSTNWNAGIYFVRLNSHLNNSITYKITKQ